MSTTELKAPAATVRKLRSRTAASTRPSWSKAPSIPIRVSKAIAVIVLCLVILFPLLIVVSTSLSTAESLRQNGGFAIIPTSFSIEAYRQVLSGGVVSRAVVISLLVTIVGTAISLICTVLAAYALSRKGSLFQKPLLGLVLLTFLFTPGLIPVYLMVKQLGLLDTYWSLILPGAVSAFNIVIVRGFFQNIPQELIDSAKIDGASEWRTLWSIMLPLSKAVVAVVGLFYAVGYWNSFFNALIYLQDSSKWTLQLVLRSYVLQGAPLLTDTGTVVDTPTAAIQMAVIVIAMVPVLCAYPFVQRHMSAGVMTGAVKG
ncbi:carbohydrate ABC transporter permease [Psychromicrobium xiongbiense]|uniref:carbohydrate ABC transporter permease n=1 Tax=Psychromicrobium xiongbiense TaxID=3051184 RepID=UPI0025523529|nr:carbohydrate ABC transporter permease [Psychromicrobium sp. YIM S02556]